MTCEDAQALVEPVAAGDVEPGARERAHFESCPRCAGALASARRVEALLRARRVVPAPPNFTAAVLLRLRRERWRAEQQVDRVFNAAIGLGALAIVAGLVAVFNVGAVLSAVATVWAAVGPADGLRTGIPSLELSFAAAGLLATALLMWWWAERTWSW
jgi:anti-sigma factor RsiW